MKNKIPANVTSTILGKAKMKCFKKMCDHDKVIVALTARKEKYLNYEKGILLEMYACIVITMRR